MRTRSHFEIWPPVHPAVLALLASRPGELVSHDEIRREIWGDTVHVNVTENLHYCIRRIRLAVGDTARSSRTGELNRLAALLNVRSGSTVADVGAGDGSFALAMARLVGPSGTVYATELSAKQLDVIKKKVTESGSSRVRVVEASAAATNFPEQCCDAIYLRTVLHHIADRKAFAHQVRKAVLPKGRLAVIDFAPGDLWFHGRDHGVTSQAAIEAFRAAGWSLIDHQPHWEEVCTCCFSSDRRNDTGR